MAAIPQSEGDNLLQAAQLCAGGLEGLGLGFLNSFHGTEKDFLRLGAQLEGFSSRSSQTSALAAGLTELTSGEAVAEASAKLAANLERLGGICDVAATDRQLAELGRVGSMGAKLGEIMNDFARLVKHLSMLGVSTRIESARLGDQGAGFATLADDVEKLAGKIGESSGKILVSANELSNQCRSASISLKQMDEARKGCSISALSLLEADLSALEGLTRASREAADSVSSLSRSVVSSISEAVLSMQFHDIIRQQLEHVAEAAEEARDIARSGPGEGLAAEAADWEEVCDWLHSIADLQRSQLGNARTRFAKAMQTLEDSLASIGSQVREMASGAASLAAKEAGQEGVLAQIEAGVGQIAASLREYSQLETGMGSIMAQVAESIAGMSSIVGEIEEVGSEIELIAINASIKAAHTGDEGKALGVLASAIQKLSVDARGQTARILELLGSVDAATFSANAQGDQGARLEAVVSGLDAEVASIKALDHEAATQAAMVQSAAEELSGDIAAAVASLDFRWDLIDAVTAAETRLQELVDELGAALPPGHRASRAPTLMQMLQRYTMDEERLVHEQALGLSGSVTTTASGDDDGLGDNVELF
ncbi:hypothetical protein [Fundidesulfovibrio agrisoli]|uniref:hypothetical protein n=1 Tax=Fundidesulfovibrio agrisoli TaxID=2922717 RepID=UPI001FAC360A|nr:hypothetical protein [Fundidesulfovibrio agrisoli]